MAGSFKFSLVFKGILIATVLAAILSLLFGLLLSFTSIPESDLSAHIIYSISIFLAALLITSKTGNKGMLYGVMIGIGFVLILLVFTAIVQPSAPSWIKIGEKLIFSVVAGGIGGVSGIFFSRA